MSLPEFRVEMGDEEIDYPYPESEVRLLSHPVKSVRLRAYKAVDAILSGSSRDGRKIETYPLFLFASGDPLAAIEFLISEAITRGRFQNIGVATEVFMSAIGEYERVKKVLDTGTHPEFKSEDRIAISAIQRAIRRFGTLFPGAPETNRLLSHYSQRVLGQKNEAYELLGKIVQESADKAIAEDYLRLGDLIREMGGEMSQSAECYYRGIEKFPTDTSLFERYAKCLLQIFGEAKAKRFYQAFREKAKYKLPFSALRGKIHDTEDTIELSRTVEGFQDGQKIEHGTLEYFHSVHTQLMRSYHSLKTKASPPPQDVEPSPESKSQYFHSVGGRILLLEHLLFRLYDFRYVLEYVRLISSVKSMGGGRAFLTSYFLENPLIVPKKGDPDEEIGGEDNDPNSGFTLESEIQRRYAFISKKFFYQTPGFLAGYDFSSTGHELPTSDVDPTFSSTVLSVLGNEMLDLTGNEDAMERNHELSHMLQREARLLLVAGNLAGWHDTLIREVLSNSASPVLHTLSYHARIDEYAGKSLPPVCSGNTRLAYFFVVERIIGDVFDTFGGEFDSIVKKYRFFDIALTDALNLSKLLMARGYYREAFEFLSLHPSTISFTEGLYLLTECLKYIASADPVAAEKLLSELDEKVAASSKDNTFIERIEECFDGIVDDMGSLQAQFAQSRAQSPRARIGTGATPGTQILELQAEQGKLAYCLAFLTMSEPVVSGQFLHVASTMRSPEACILEVEFERGTKTWDPEDALFRLEQQFFSTDGGPIFPVKKEYIIALIELSGELNDAQRRDRYLQMARMYGIDVFRYEFDSLLSTPEKRKQLYEYLLTKNFDTFFRGKFDLLGELQKHLNHDLTAPEIPLEIKLLAGFIKKGISSDKEFGYIPVTLEYWRILSSSLADPLFSEKYPELIEKGCSITVGGEGIPIRCLTALEYLLEKDDAFFRERLKEIQRIPDKDHHPYLEMYGQFLESVLDILGTYPASSYEISRFTQNTGESTTSLYNYWKQKLEAFQSPTSQSPRPLASIHGGTHSLH